MSMQLTTRVRQLCTGLCSPDHQQLWSYYVNMAQALVQQTSRAVHPYTMPHLQMMLKQSRSCCALEPMQKQLTVRDTLCLDLPSAASQDTWAHVCRYPTSLDQFKSKHLEAVKLTYHQTVDTLLAHGADVSACNYQGLTALHCAARDDNLEMLITLVGCGLDVNARAFEDWTPLHYAVHRCSIEMARVLIDAGAVVSAKDEKGCTPLHGCAQTYKHEGMLQLRHNSRMYPSGSPEHLHAAAQLADLLVAHGADPATQNKQGKIPRDLALSHDDSPLERVLSKIAHQAET